MFRRAMPVRMAAARPGGRRGVTSVPFNESRNAIMAAGAAAIAFRAAFQYLVMLLSLPSHIFQLLLVLLECKGALDLFLASYL